MVKRLAAAYLWIMACWSVGGLLDKNVGMSESVGLVIGIVVAVVIMTMPDRLWTRRIAKAVTASRFVEPGPIGDLSAAD